MAPLTYSDYLGLPTLLDLQHPRSSPAEHDEMLFIVIHQTYELWFRLALHEVSKLNRNMSDNDLFGAIHTAKRIRTIWKTVVQQVDILETMTPLSFASFRDRLDTASGLQSLQFRELEFAFGYKRAELAKAGSPLPGYEGLQRRLGERSVMDHLMDLLEQRGVKIPAELRGRDVTLATEPNQALQDELLRVYHEQPELVLLFESLMDFDEGFQEWRYRHVKLVERTIGAKLGTGGTAGVDFLKRSLFKPLFPDLWAVRYRM